MRDLGNRLKKLRTERGLTLARLGQKAGLSASYLSQIERGVATPSLGRLADLAMSLGVDLSLFFEDDVSAPRVLRAGQGWKLTGAAGAAVELLSTDLADKKILPYRMVCQPGASGSREASDSGEECCFVLKGQLTLTVGKETFVLGAGDSLHYQRRQPHSWRNRGDQECVVIWAISAPVSKDEIVGGLMAGKEVV